MGTHIRSENPSLPNLAKLDGWKNLVSGLGILGRDKTKSIRPGESPNLQDVELADLYKGDGTASAVVDAAADDMTRAGWVIEGDTKGELDQIQQVLEVKKKVNLALKWARLYRGSIIALDFQGAGAWDEPLKTTSTKSPQITALRVYAAPRIEILDTDFVTDEQSPYFEDLEFFRVRKRYGGYYNIHRSRCLVFFGSPCPDDLINTEPLTNRFWGLSALQKGYDHLKIFGAFMQGMGVLGEEFSVAKITLSNLEQLVAEGNFRAVEQRAEIIAITKSLINAVLLGEGEGYDRDNITFTGVPDLIDRMMMVVSGSYRYPVTRLFGRSAAGLNATGENDERNYYDMISSAQEIDLLPQIYILMQHLNAMVGFPVKPEELTIKFNPVWSPSQQQLVEMKHKQAQIDKIYSGDLNVLTGEEVRENRFAGGYSFDTEVDSGTIGYTPPETEED